MLLAHRGLGFVNREILRSDRYGRNTQLSKATLGSRRRRYLLIFICTSSETIKRIGYLCQVKRIEAVVVVSPIKSNSNLYFEVLLAFSVSLNVPESELSLLNYLTNYGAQNYFY